MLPEVGVKVDTAASAAPAVSVNALEVAAVNDVGVKVRV
jgi:hypothetical protein